MYILWRKARALNIANFILCLSLYNEFLVLDLGHVLNIISITFSLFRVEQVNKDSIETFFNSHVNFMRDTFGVLLFLYTVMHSKVNSVTFVFIKTCKY